MTDNNADSPRGGWFDGALSSLYDDWRSVPSVGVSHELNSEVLVVKCSFGPFVPRQEFAFRSNRLYTRHLRRLRKILSLKLLCRSYRCYDSRKKGRRGRRGRRTQKLFLCQDVSRRRVHSLLIVDVSWQIICTKNASSRCWKEGTTGYILYGIWYGIWYGIAALRYCVDIIVHGFAAEGSREVVHTCISCARRLVTYGAPYQ